METKYLSIDDYANLYEKEVEGFNKEAALQRLKSYKFGLELSYNEASEEEKVMIKRRTKAVIQVIQKIEKIEE